MTASCWSGETGRIAASTTRRVSHTGLHGHLVRRSRRAVARGVSCDAARHQHHGSRRRTARSRVPALGGRREPRADSPHHALRVAAFRGYADHMSSAEFARGYERLVSLARESRTAFMCAETLWWRCHRRLIADRLTIDGWTVTHLFAPGKSEPHVL